MNFSRMSAKLFRIIHRATVATPSIAPDLISMNWPFAFGDKTVAWTFPQPATKGAGARLRKLVDAIRIIDPRVTELTCDCCKFFAILERHKLSPHELLNR